MKYKTHMRTLLCIFGIALLSGCTSVPYSHMDLPLESISKYKSEPTPKLEGVLNSLSGRMTRDNYFVASDNDTVLFHFYKYGGKWYLRYVYGWSHYDKAFCALQFAAFMYNSRPEGSACAKEVGTNFVLFVAIEGQTLAMSTSLGLKNNKIGIQIIDFPSGKEYPVAEQNIVPATVSQAELSEALTDAKNVEKNFQEQVSYAARNAKRLNDWHAVHDPYMEKVRAYNAAMNEVYKGFQQLEENRQAARQREQEQLIRLSGLGSKNANDSNGTGVFAAQDEPSVATDRPASSDTKRASRATVARQNRSSIDTSHSTNSSQDAALLDDAQRRIAEDDERIRKNREMQRIAREQSSRRYEETQRELAAANEKARKEREKQSDLDRLQSRITMGAKQCGNGDVRVGGILPASARQFEHIRVEFTVYCPGNTSVRGAISNFLGDGYSCVGSDMVQVQIPCDVRQARVVVDKVAGSN